MLGWSFLETPHFKGPKRGYPLKKISKRPSLVSIIVEKIEFLYFSKFRESVKKIQSKGGPLFSEVVHTIIPSLVFLGGNQSIFISLGGRE